MFGDLGDESSRVAKLSASERAFRVLDDLGTKPHTHYLARIRNPNPRMPDYTDMPLSRVENWSKNHPAKKA